MEKIVAPNGSQINFEAVLTKLQLSGFNNLKRRVAELFTSYGILAPVNNGVLGTDLLPTLVTSGTQVSINPGKILFTSGEFAELAATVTISNLAVANVNTAYAIVATYKEQGSIPVKAANAFVFDALGATSLSRNTFFEDSVSVKSFL